MLLIILLVVFVVVMLVWFLGLTGTLGGTPAADRRDWLAFLAVLVLGIVVFLVGSGTIIIEKVAVK